MGIARHLMMMTALLSIMLMVPAIVSAENVLITYDLPSQEVVSALDAFAEKTNLSLMYLVSDLEQIKANAISGIYTPEQALDIMLDGTGLVYEFTSDTTVSIRKNGSGEPGNLNSKEPQSPPPLVENSQPDQVLLAEAPAASAASADGESGSDDLSQDFVLEETVVTASKRETKVQDTPMSIQALTGDKLEEMAAVGMEDFSDRIPGLTVSVQGMGMNSLQIRGITTLTSEQTSSATVGYYLDDTPISSPSFVPDVALFDVERIEVLKGPQGTLYGEGSLGGTVRLITRKPQFDEFEGKVQLVGSQTEESDGFNYQTNGVINVPLMDDKLAMRLSGSFSSNAGFSDDVNSGDKDTNDSELGNIRAVVRFKPVPRLEITPGILYQNTDGGGNAFDSDLYGDMEYFRETPNKQWYEDDYILYTLNADLDLDWASLVSNTSYFDREHSSMMDFAYINGLANQLIAGYNFNFGSMLGLIDSSPYTEQDMTLDTTVFSQEFRLVSDDTDALKWVAGVFYRERKIDNRTYLGNEQFGSVRSNLGLPGGETIFDSDFKQESKQIALFGELDYTFIEKLTLSGGARWFREEIDGDSTYLTAGQAPNPFALVGGETISNIDQEDVLYKLGVKYNPTDATMLYAQFTQGIRPGGSNARAAAFGGGADVNTEFKSDSTDNYEVGIKSDWLGGRLRTNLAYYYIVWDDIQVLDRGSLGQTFVVNAGEAESSGVELELLAQPLIGLTLGFNAAYNEAEISKETPIAAGFIPKGATIPFSPEWTYTLFADYAFPIKGELNGFVGADFQYVDDRVEDIETSAEDETVLDSYQTIGLRAGVMKENWRFSIFANNVTDERAEMRGTYDLPQQGWVRNTPRTIGAQFTYNF